MFTGAFVATEHVGKGLQNFGIVFACLVDTLASRSDTRPGSLVAPVCIAGSFPFNLVRAPDLPYSTQRHGQER